MRNKKQIAYKLDRTDVDICDKGKDIHCIKGPPHFAGPNDTYVSRFDM